MGAPALPFDADLADEVLERISTSEMGLEQVLAERASKGLSIVGQTTWYKWLNQYPDFAKKSARARQIQAELLHDRAQVAAREPLVGEIVTESDKDGRSIKIVDNVERSKLIVQTLLKRAGQLDHSRYGDKVDVNHGVQTDKLSEFRDAFAAGPVPQGQTNHEISDEDVPAS